MNERTRKLRLDLEQSLSRFLLFGVVGCVVFKKVLGEDRLRLEFGALAVLLKPPPLEGNATLCRRALLLLVVKDDPLR